MGCDRAQMQPSPAGETGPCKMTPRQIAKDSKMLLFFASWATLYDVMNIFLIILEAPLPDGLGVLRLFGLSHYIIPLILAKISTFLRTAREVVTVRRVSLWGAAGVAWALIVLVFIVLLVGVLTVLGDGGGSRRG